MCACVRGSARGGRPLAPPALRAPTPSRLPSSPLSGSRPRASSAVERTQDTLSHVRLGGGASGAAQAPLRHQGAGAAGVLLLQSRGPGRLCALGAGQRA